MERGNSERAVAEALRLRDAEVARERALKETALEDARAARKRADELSSLRGRHDAEVSEHRSERERRDRELLAARAAAAELRAAHADGVAPQVLFLDGDHLAPGALGIKERKVFESPPEPRARMAAIRDSLSPVDAASAFASAAAQRASRRSRREPNTPLSRGMSEPERGV